MKDTTVFGVEKGKPSFFFFSFLFYSMFSSFPFPISFLFFFADNNDTSGQLSCAFLTCYFVFSSFKRFQFKSKSMLIDVYLSQCLTNCVDCYKKRLLRFKCMFFEPSSGPGNRQCNGEIWLTLVLLHNPSSRRVQRSSFLPPFPPIILTLTLGSSPNDYFLLCSGFQRKSWSLF